MPTGWQPLPRSKSRPKGSLLVGPSAPASHKGAILGQYPPDSSQSYSIEKNIAENDSVYVLTEIDLGHDARRSFHRSPTPSLPPIPLCLMPGRSSAGWNCCNTESTISSGTCGARFSFNPAAADWADGYKLRGAKSQVCDRQERRSAT
jgi:hypothetical protein